MAEKCGELVKQAHSSRIRHAYNALVEIRKKCMRTTKDVDRLIAARLVPRIMDLIRSKDSLDEQYRSKVIDIAVSILGNMCMEGVTRSQMLKDKGTGVTILVELFEEIETESLQNRTCRCLSNMLLSPGSWELVCCSSVIEKIVKLLQDTEQEEYKQTCIRAIRLLGQTGCNVQKLVEKNAINVVLKLIDCDTESLKKSSLRCVHSLSTHGCTIQFASQVIASGKLTYLLDCVRDSNFNMFQLLIRLCEHHNFRAEFGNVGGIAQFRDMCSSDEPFCKELRVDVLSVLCLCCKEAVNRVKIRDENVLVLLTDSLSNDDFTNVHARVISAFVCFLYDAASFDVLLDNGIVPLLVKHLKQCFETTSEADDVGQQEVFTEEKEAGLKHRGKRMNRESICCFEEQKILSNKNIEETNMYSACKQNKVLDNANESKKYTAIVGSILLEDKDTKGVTDNDIVVQETGTTAVKDFQSITDSDNEFKVVQGTGTAVEQCESITDNENKVVQETGTAVKETKGVTDNDNEDKVVKGTAIKEHTSIAEGGKEENEQPVNIVASRPIYSIDSPTYEPNIEWDYKDYDGAKCIERFTPPHDVDYTGNRSYSPISNSSYYSPGESSPECRPSVDSSPEYSPASCPGDSPVLQGCSQSGFHGYRPNNVHPKYTGVSCQLYRTEQSPCVSPEPGNHSNKTSPVSTDKPSTDRAIKQGSNNINLSPGAKSPSSSCKPSPDRVSELDMDSESLSVGMKSPYSVDEISEDPFTVEFKEENTDSCRREIDFTLIDSKSDPALERNFIVCESKEEVANCREQLPAQYENNENTSEGKIQEMFNQHLLKLKDVLVSGRKRGIKRKKTSSRNNVAEYNILILLSRVSQMTDPTRHLVTKDVIHHLLGYISQMEAPLARCPRLLSRVLRNPLCLQKLLSLQVPHVIYENLLSGENLQALTINLKKNRKTVRRKSSYGNSEVHYDVRIDSDRFSASNNSLLEQQEYKRRRAFAGDLKQSHSFKGQHHKQEEDICDRGRSGMACLEDLSGVVDSKFGRGTVDRLLHTISGDQMTNLCINMLYITWTLASRHYFFKQREILDQVLNILQPSGNFDNKQFTAIISGLTLIVQIIDTRNKYQIYNTRQSSDGSTSLQHVSSIFHASSSTGKPSEKHPSGLSDQINVSLVAAQGNVMTGRLIDRGSKLDSTEDPNSCDDTINECFIKRCADHLDTAFIVMDAKIYASRSVLVERSEIFAAMLDGHYSEASSSEIPIPESTKFSFEYLIHHLHGCKAGYCAVIDQLFTQTVNRYSAKQCIALLEEANKYLLSTLYVTAYECLFTRYLIPASAFAVYKYAVLHRKDKLLKACVSCILYDTKCTETVAEYFCEFLSSRYSGIFLSTLRDILSE